MLTQLAGWRSLFLVNAAALAAVMLGLARLELAASTPVLRLDLFRRTVFAFSNLAALIHYSATFAVSFLLSLYLQYVKGLAPTAAGLVLVAQPAVMAALAVLGLGFGLFSSPNANAVMSAVERRDYGIASSTLGTMRLTGQMPSMGVATLILAVHVGSAPLGAQNQPQLIRSARVAFVFFGLLCFGGVFASLARGSRVTRSRWFLRVPSLDVPGRCMDSVEVGP